ncbi:MAG TPA: methionyl-tRNA formyltransferase [Minicystis sp.]|nr:methionyl-tRNA formyltransferase [Minicystis sp.]
MRALFFGTPALAVPSLDALADVAEVVGVVCQPDRPAGRGLELKPPPVKVRALERGLDVAQPTKIRTPEFAAFIAEKRADVALVIAYGRILPKAVLEAPRRGCMNLHASLLPKYRGAAPIAWAIANGEAETGVCLMQMDEGMDTGPVYSAHRLAIGPDETADELAVRVGALAADVVRRDLAAAVEGRLAATPQDAAAATVAPILEKEHGRVDWALCARAVHDRARAMTSWPGAFTTANGKTLKLLATRLAEEDAVLGAPGAVVSAGKDGAVVACGRGGIRLLRAQVEGRRPQSVGELVSGRALAAGMRLGT